MMFVGKAVLEMKVYHEGRAMQTTRPDAERKLKVSLLDGISEIHPPAGGWYEVYETAPTGDLAKARIVAMLPSGSAESELTILVGRRTLEHYFVEDPLISSFQQGHDLAGRHN